MAFRAVLARLAQHFGQGWTVSIRRHHSLIDETDAPPAALPLVGNHAAGATAVTLGGTLRLDGTIVPGLRLTIGAVAYEVAGEVRAESDVLAGVPLLTPLAASFANGTAVTIESHRDYTFPAFALQRRSDLSANLQPDAGHSVALSAEGAPTVPRPDDLVMVSGVWEEQTNLRTIQGGAVPDGWVLTVRGRAA